MQATWMSFLLRSLLIAVLALCVGFYAGGWWAWMAAAICFALLTLDHTRQLARLTQWVSAPRLETIPQGTGDWELPLGELYRLNKAQHKEVQSLLQSMARFRDAARALPDGVVTLNAAHQIEWANPTAELLLAIDAERDQGRAITNLVRNPDFVEYLRLGVYTAPLILRNVRGDASVLTVRAVAFGSERMLLLVRDITHEENIERLRRDFVANVSHELKTPITVLAGFVETLANPDIELEPAQRTHFLALMAEQSERMQRLIEDLLTLSALESAARPSTESIIEMPSLIQQVMPTIQALSDGKHQFICEVEALTLKGNAQEIISVISNLASNAVRYTPAGGTIRVTWTQRDEHAVLSVTDSGIGIEAQHLSRLTERFYRVDTSRSRESGGTGLGLAIVKHVLTRHQAKLEIHSTPGQGSTFSAVFPAQRVQPLHE